MAWRGLGSCCSHQMACTCVSTFQATYEKPFWRAGRGPPPSRYTNTGVEYRNEEDPEDYEGVVNLGEQYQARCTALGRSQSVDQSLA